MAGTNYCSDVWDAGQTYEVVIAGSGFGTVPDLRWNGTGFTYQVNSQSDTEIHVSVQVESTAPDQTVYVEVVSNGYYGFGFQQGQGGQGPVSQQGAAQVRAALPVPRIYRHGVDITNTSQTVIVGEVVDGLTAQVSGTYSGGTWDIPAETFGGYPSSVQSGGPMLAVSSNQSSIALLIFRAAPSGPAMLRYTVTANGSSFTASVTFNVVAPVLTTSTAIGLGAASVDQDSESGSGTWALHYGGGSGQQGMRFEVSGTMPNGYAGRAEWVQIVNSSLRRRYSGLGAQLQSTFQCQGLDAGNPPSFPYHIGNATQDSPSQPLNTSGNDGTQSYSNADYYDAADNFTMWVMFRPTSVQSSVLVPLGKIVWSWSGNAVWTGTIWVGGGSGSPMGQVVVPGAVDFPTWTSNSAICSWN